MCDALDSLDPDRTQDFEVALREYVQIKVASIGSTQHPHSARIHRANSSGRSDMAKKAKKLRDDIEAVQDNMSAADAANQAAILYLLDEVAALKEELAARKKQSK